MHLLLYDTQNTVFDLDLLVKDQKWESAILRFMRKILLYQVS